MKLRIRRKNAVAKPASTAAASSSTSSSSSCSSSSSSSPTSGVHWQEDLSPELWMHVLTFTSPRDCLQSVVRVSKHFHQLLADPAYWNTYTKALISSAAGGGNQNVNLSNNKEELESFVYLQHALNLNLNCHQLQRLCLYFVVAQKKNASAITPTSLNNTKYPKGLHYGSLLLDRTAAIGLMQEQRRRVCLATSTEHLSEMLENVLGEPHNDDHNDDNNDNDVRRRRRRSWDINRLQWWSSKPSTTQNSNDTLLFVTNCPLAVLSRLSIRPLMDPFTRAQVYSWQRTIVKAYRLPLERVCPDEYNHDDNTNNTNKPDHHTQFFRCSLANAIPSMHVDDHDIRPSHVVDSTHERRALDTILDGLTPVFECTVDYDNDNDNSSRRRRPQQQGLAVPLQSQDDVPWQTVTFSTTTKGGVVIANAVTITLCGKDCRQFEISGYYACVEQVRLQGIPLLADPHHADAFVEME